MQGLAAIAAHNGWAMAATGACIVFTGLTVLSIIISQLHNIIGFFDKKEAAVETAPVEPEEAPAAAPGLDETAVLSDLAASARLHKSVASPLGDTFELAQLYKALEAANLPHPHITVRELKSAGYLVAVEEGLFSWKNI